jgi:RsiW-degrading membrane proteinase PrsW (M82 family)
LASIYYRSSKSKELAKLIENKNLSDFIPHKIKAEYYFETGQDLNYWIEQLKHSSTKLNIYGFLGAFLILVVWLVFMRKLNPFYTFSWTWTFIVLFLSMSLTFLCSYWYDFFQYKFNFTQFSHPFLFTVFGIGLIEEVVKCVPFLLVILFSKDKKEPFSYIYYAAISALGFAFVENAIVYFEPDNINFIQSRGFSTSFGHIVFLSFLGYCLFINQFILKINKFLVFIIGLFLAMFLHGLYDYIIFSEQAPLVFYAYFFILVHVWVLMCNNVLNVSPNFSFKKLENYTDIKFYFSLALVSIVMAEYILLTVQMGKEVANDALAGNLFGSTILMVFMGTSLTNYNFFKGYIEKIKIPYQLHTIFFPRLVNDESFVLAAVLLTKTKFSRANFEPKSGTIVSRHVLKNDSDWYLVCLDVPLNTDLEIHKQYVFINIDEHNASIKDFEKVKVSCYCISEKADLESIRINQKSLSNKVDCLLEERL